MTRLPRGPHTLSRAEVADSQRTRLLDACTRLLADGWAAVTIGALAARAGVSRGAFYEHFAGKQECLLAAYERFAAGITSAMTAGDPADLDAFVDQALDGYLGTLAADPVAARAFIVEMDAAGPAARARRREAIHGFAALLRARGSAALPERAYLALALGVRELVRESLETDPEPDLLALGPDIRVWVDAMLAGA